MQFLQQLFQSVRCSLETRTDLIQLLSTCVKTIVQVMTVTATVARAECAIANVRHGCSFPVMTI